MSPKRAPTPSTPDIKPKKPRKSLNLDVKIEIVQRNDGGEKSLDVRSFRYTIGFSGMHPHHIWGATCTVNPR